MIEEFRMIEEYLQYQGQKYVSPKKAIDEEEFMFQFKSDGGKARNQFKKIVEEIDRHQTYLKMQRVSNWMNQAQFGTTMFYCFFRGIGDKMSEPGIAIRLYLENDRLGVTWEVSVLERTLDKDSLKYQHQILKRPITDPLYYLVYQNGIGTIYPGTEDNRIYLINAVDTQQVRKVLVKVLIGYFDEFTSIESLALKAKEKLDVIFPYYLATREGKDRIN